MVSIYYFGCLIVSIVNLVYLTQKKNKYADKYYWSMVLLIPLVLLGYWIRSTVHTAEAAEVSLSFIYIDSTVLLVLVLFSVLQSMEVEVKTWTKLSVYGITAIHLLSIWLTRGTKLYYASVEIERNAWGTATIVTSGPLKITHYIFLGCGFVGLVIVLLIGLFKKDTYSRKTLACYSFMAIAAIIIYVVEMILDVTYTVLPGLYALGSLLITMTYDHIQSHDIFNLIGEKQAKTGIRGYCAFDMERCLLGYNRQFTEMLPDITKVIIDEKIPPAYSELEQFLYRAIDVFDTNKEYSEIRPFGDRVYKFVITAFSVNSERRANGYLLELTDVTDEQKKLDIVEEYNERLSEEVNQKTEHILEIQNSVVLGLANMVENRDDNTGGHVKRTSEVIKILIKEVQRQDTYPITKKMAKDIVRAASMHDLGKISIDSAILCKPGKLTEEEYAIMKTHAPKSGEIVNIILEGVEEQHFVDVAYRLARHHHERWDGKGYPDRLLGESIPVEARIMAVADVYDALVSKRCYKEPMSFEQAAVIMNECMGSQFDPAMRPVFVACREKLEQYYSQNA